MGGPMQPQGHLQVFLRIINGLQNPQAACDAPRWFIHPNGEISFESLFDQEVINGLQERGHTINKQNGTLLFGGAQAIIRQDNGSFVAGSDWRKDGLAMGC